MRLNQIKTSMSIRQNKLDSLDPIRNKKQIITLTNKIENYRKEFESI